MNSPLIDTKSCRAWTVREQEEFLRPGINGINQSNLGNKRNYSRFFPILLWFITRLIWEINERKKQGNESHHTRVPSSGIYSKIARIICVVSYPSRLIGREMIIHQWSWIYWSAIEPLIPVSCFCFGSHEKRDQSQKKTKPVSEKKRSVLGGGLFHNATHVRKEFSAVRQ